MVEAIKKDHFHIPGYKPQELKTKECAGIASNLPSISLVMQVTCNYTSSASKAQQCHSFTSNTKKGNFSSHSWYYSGQYTHAQLQKYALQQK